MTKNIQEKKEEIFGESLSLYDEYNWEHRITDYNNYIYGIYVDISDRSDKQEEISKKKIKN